MDFDENPLNFMTFPDFPATSGKYEIHPPKLCASLRATETLRRNGGHERSPRLPTFARTRLVAARAALAGPGPFAGVLALLGVRALLAPVARSGLPPTHFFGQVPPLLASVPRNPDGPRQIHRFPYVQITDFCVCPVTPFL